jgi:hypothetical protein
MVNAQIVGHFIDCGIHGAFLERKFDMKERISTFYWDRLGTPSRLKKCDLKKISGALFEKSAHSDICFMTYKIKLLLIRHISPKTTQF